MRAAALASSSAIFSCLGASQALAHAGERGYVLLLPTGYYMAGGAAAVTASFLVLALLPPRVLERVATQRLALFSIGEPFGENARIVVSLLSFAVFAMLVAAGFLGSRDPLSNPLPLVVWTMLWVGLTLLQGLFGNLWASINPWYGPWRVVSALLPSAVQGRRLPVRLGYWPAVFLFFGFAWFELIDPAPDDPARLAWATGAYWLLAFVLMLVFGYDEWSRRGEFLSVFYRMVSRFAVVEATSTDGRSRLKLCWPGAKLWGEAALPASGMFFLILTLSSVSFDGLSHTFFWLGLNGINPLEFPGRSAVMGIGTAGLLGMFAVLSGAYLLAVFLGERLAGSRRPFWQTAGLLVWSIVPIALAYHFSHYLTALLVNGQYALVALSDPFSNGWDLFGTAGFEVGVGLVAGYESAWMLWNAQAAAIIGGHVLAVLIAHALAFRLHPTPSRAMLGQLPLTVLMVGYTVFGLWLLSTPTAG
ncbi:hypothetical protein [Mesorhizobium sp. KR1-2]|uniref:hypothetical protein n=1 Tax=Mesorhizobium sp. KR1-2 TaxID=3156609 RepID=UPI0032B34F26